jgi:hypothetical protein
MLHLPKKHTQYFQKKKKIKILHVHIRIPKEPIHLVGHVKNIVKSLTLVLQNFVVFAYATQKSRFHSTTL